MLKDLKNLNYNELFSRLELLEKKLIENNPSQVVRFFGIKLTSSTVMAAYRLRKQVKEEIEYQSKAPTKGRH